MWPQHPLQKACNEVFQQSRDHSHLVWEMCPAYRDCSLHCLPYLFPIHTAHRSLRTGTTEMFRGPNFYSRLPGEAGYPNRSGVPDYLSRSGLLWLCLCRDPYCSLLLWLASKCGAVPPWCCEVAVLRLVTA